MTGLLATSFGDTVKIADAIEREVGVLGIGTVCPVGCGRVLCTCKSSVSPVKLGPRQIAIRSEYSWQQGIILGDGIY
ncbi:MAG: hypothetical protein HYX79_07360 [Chloroflexi bacterium]|nr:hypothetical protein [Chloroflexota bacterium]